MTEIIGMVNEDSSFVFLARLEILGVIAKQADFDSITYAVTNADTRDVIVAASPLTITNVVYDELQSVMWEREDRLGYNFRHDIPASICTDADVKYRFEWTITPTDGGQQKVGPLIMSVNDMHS